MTDPEGVTGGPEPPPGISQSYRVTWIYWSRSPGKSQSFQAALNVGPSSARQRYALLVGRLWPAFHSTLHQIKKRKMVKNGHPLTKFSESGNHC